MDGLLTGSDFFWDSGKGFLGVQFQAAKAPDFQVYHWWRNTPGNTLYSPALVETHPSGENKSAPKQALSENAG
jgi:hypothetical protein